MSHVDREAPIANQSAHTVAVALGANICVGLAKLTAAVVTGSAAMWAEATHALADVGNQLLLVTAQRRSARMPDSKHPFGYGRDAYFWALIASIVVFTAGAGFSLREGIDGLTHPIVGSSFTTEYVVLGICLLVDYVSLRQSSRQLRLEASDVQREFLDHLMLTSDPTVRAVFAEDAAAIAGDLIALTGIAVHQAIGSSAPEGFSAIVIGLLLIGVGAQLARRNHDFLLGEQATPAVTNRVRSLLVSFDGVIAVRELLITFVGPRQMWVLARVDIDDNLRGNEVEALVRNVEATLKRQSRHVTRVDVVPIGDPRSRPPETQ